MKSKIITGIFAVLSISAVLFAADLTYTTVPQTGDSDLVIRNKQAVAVTKLAAENGFLYIAASGTNAAVTNSVSTNSVILDRLVINAAGAAASTITLKTGTNTVSVVSGASGPVALPYNLRLPSGLSVVTAGTNAPALTVGYR